MGKQEQGSYQLREKERPHCCSLVMQSAGGTAWEGPLYL